MVQLLYGLLLIVRFIVSYILKLFFRLIFLICKNLVAFNTNKIKPLLNSFYEYLYSRACEAFDCGIEQQNENRNSEEQEIAIPLFNRIGAFFLKLVLLFFRRKKEVINRNKKSVFKNRKKRGQQNKGAASTYLALFQALFRVLGY
ncbi:hypothetical protein OAN33_04870 [Flavobacteriales bacterium]|nr:hypothetical protein [Flavobacteriales bacterium]